MSPNQPGNRVRSISNPGGPRHTSPDDLTLYAMQLLPAEESAVVARHLETCAECRSELARIHGDLAAYALTADLETPPALSRERLIEQVAREKKVVFSVAPKRPASQAPAPQAPAQPAQIADFGRTPTFGSTARPSSGPGRSVLAWSGWAVAASLAVALGFLYGDRSSLRENLTAQAGQIQRLNTDAAASHQLMDALTDPRAVRVTLTAKPLPRRGPMGGVTYNPTKGSLVFLASDLDPLKLYKTYELWIIPTTGAPIPAGTFHPDDHGNASVIMPDLPKDVAAKAFGVTIENDGGAKTPTMPIIMAGS